MRTGTVKDYIYCIDCNEYIDFFKYDCILDTDHPECNWRYVNKGEYEECLKDCIADGGEQ